MRSPDPSDHLLIPTSASELDVDDDEGLGSSPPASPGPPMAFADSTMPPIAAN